MGMSRPNIDTPQARVKVPRQEPGASSASSINRLEPSGLPLHLQTGVWSFMRLNEIHKATSNFNKQFFPVSESLFGTKEPSPARYIASAKEQFGSPFFEILRKYLAPHHKSANFIQSILNIPLLDAQNVYEALQ